MDIFKWLDDSSLVDSYTINDFRKSESAFYLNLKIKFIDNSELHVREYLDTDHRKYSFHWQTPSSDLIVRWDNAPPHFQELATFPHHKHLTNEQVAESHNIAFDEVMEIIAHHLATDLTP